jgi:hypothetical protein
MRQRYYVGLTPSNREVFRSPVAPTDETHGHVYNAVIGPFRTKRGAAWMADPVKGAGNPHCRCMSDAEYLAKKYSN